MVQNTDSNGRFHTDWLNMIYPRLKVAKDLLTDDGVIFISIDDHEVENLKKACNEIFGQANYVDTLVWQKLYGIKNDSKWFSHAHDYVIVYAKNKLLWYPNLLPRTEEANARYKNPDNDPRGNWKSADFTAIGETKSSIFDIVTPSGRVVSPPAGKRWIVAKETYETLRADNRLWFGKDGNSIPSIKRFLSEVQDGLKQTTILTYQEVGHSDAANKELKNLLAGSIFDYPKPVSLAQRLVHLGTNRCDIILDFFSGSATTAHAVMQLNAEDGGNRKFIMVQLPEVTDEKSEAYRAGYKNICEIGKERIRRAGKKILEESEALRVKSGVEQPDLLSDSSKLNPPISTLDVGFRVLKLDSTNMRDVYYNPVDLGQDMLDGVISNIKEDRTPEDLLFQVMLELGILLSSKIQIEVLRLKSGVEYKYFNVADNFLIACFDEKVTDEVVKEIARQKPYYAVLRDSSMSDDSVATNFDQIFATFSPDTVRRVL